MMKRTIRLCSSSLGDLEKVAEIIRDGGLVAFPFNGPYGIFADIWRPDLDLAIRRIKKRPKRKKLITACEPENLSGLCDFDVASCKQSQLESVWKEVHSMGAILPASVGAPEYLIHTRDDGLPTLLVIWTEYTPLRELMRIYREIGGTELLGSSANISGEPVHWDCEEIWLEFPDKFDGLVEADFSRYPEIRRCSNSIIDFSCNPPRLERLGNTLIDELAVALERSGIDPLDTSDQKRAITIPRIYPAKDLGFP